MAEVVDDGGHRVVGQPDALQQRGGVRGEQAAVVGRQADGLVAPVDEPAQGGEVAVVVGGHVGEGITGLSAPGHVVANALAEAVVVVAGVVDRQQAAVLGVEHDSSRYRKMKAAWRTSARLAPEASASAPDQPGECALEDHAGEVLGHPLLVTAALGERRFEKGRGVARTRDERVAAEQKAEDE